MITIGTRQIGPGQPCFVIAEAGVNHNGDILLAKKLIDVAAEAGADAVKFQSYRTEDLLAADAPLAAYQQRNAGVAETQFQTLKRLELSEADHRELINYTRQQGLIFLSSPFDLKSARLLKELGVEAIKIPSGEITNLPLLHEVATFGIPVILSTGMSTEAETAEAVAALAPIRDRLIILHCVSNYPAAPEECNLLVLPALAKEYGCAVGFSDHTAGIEIALAAAALGAGVIEKHFSLSRRLPGFDHAASLEPDELIQLVRGLRLVASALGDGRKKPTAGEIDTARVARKSLTAARPIMSGSILTADDVIIMRPGTGLPPSALPGLLGRRVARDIQAHSLLVEDMFS